MARAKRQRAPRAKRVIDGKLESPTISWGDAPEQFQFPSMPDLLNASDSDLLSYLQRWGMVDTMAQRKSKAAAMVADLARRPKEAGKRRFKATVQGTMRRELLQDNRRMMREFIMLDTVNGVDIKKQKFVRMGENDDSTCEGCDPLIGFEGTLAEHEAQGMPGAASCYGGDACRCTLLQVD